MIKSKQQIRHSFLDNLIINFDQGLRTIIGLPIGSGRSAPTPHLHVTSLELTTAEKKLAGNLMRINHSGEVSAQALYQGQALVAKDPEIRAALKSAAVEENDHLIWCKARIQALHTHTSYLNVVWYSGSLLIGIIAGLTGDRWSLGFLAETERQVVIHLSEHLNRLPEKDSESRAVLLQMRLDEAQHATHALQHGGSELPRPLKTMMKLMAKIMTTTVFYI